MIPLGILGAAAPRASAPPSDGDPYWANVVSLLHFDGVDGGTTFTDEKARSWTVEGAAKTTDAIKKWGAAAGDFDGVDSYIRTAHSSDLNVGSGDFTVELWVYARTRAAYKIFVAKGNSAAIELPILLSFDSTGAKAQFAVGIGGAWKIVVSSVTFPLDEWVHLRGVRYGGSHAAVSAWSAGRHLVNIRGGDG